LAARVRASISQRSVLALANPMQRLAAQLLLLAESGDEIAHAPTHQELAIMINTTRETVSRCFQTLFAQGALERHGTTLIVKRREALQAILSGDT
jgi:CRP-like cAMP-binding protein